MISLPSVSAENAQALKEMPGRASSACLPKNPDQKVSSEVLRY